jgi:hypothetical protein
MELVLLTELSAKFLELCWKIYILYRWSFSRSQKIGVHYLFKFYNKSRETSVVRGTCCDLCMIEYHMEPLSLLV